MKHEPGGRRGAVSGTSLGPADAARAALEALEGGPAVALVTLVEAPRSTGRGRRLLLLGTGETRGMLGEEALDRRALELAREALAGAPPRSCALELDGREYTLYVEAQHAAEELVIVGAGHIAVPLAQLGSLLGFRVSVLDDREEFATPARFPDAARVLHADFADPFRGVTLGPRTWVVLVTRAHKYDFDCLKRLLQRSTMPRYIGMIGSRRRTRAAFQALADAGVPAERLALVRAPVGLDIQAETPEEIAVSIAAEIIQLRRGPESAPAGEPTPLARKERVLERLVRRRAEQNAGR
ncbi:MAG: XdhC family protein [Gemmatimonadetes bacterium]|nr:XdhC family protein [Gemmatimonadota bacterium]